MAIRHLTVNVGKVGKAFAHAAYIERGGKYARQRDDDLVASGSGNMPSWATDNPVDFWAAADEHERANGTAYREIQVALPRELGSDAAHRLARDFIGRHLGTLYPYTYAVHCPLAADGHPQPHMHLMFSERALDGFGRDRAMFFRRANKKTPERGGAAKVYNPAATPTARRAALRALRAEWAELATQALAVAGHAIRIDLRSNVAQGLEQAPEPKHSPAGWRKGGREAMIAARARVAAADAAVFAADEAQRAAIEWSIEVWERLAAAAEQEKVAKAAQERQRLAAEAAEQEKAVHQAARRLVPQGRPAQPNPLASIARAFAEAQAVRAAQGLRERQRLADEAAAREKGAQEAAERPVGAPAAAEVAPEAEARRKYQEQIERENALQHEIMLAQAEYDTLLRQHPQIRHPQDRRLIRLPVGRDDVLPDPPVTPAGQAVAHLLGPDRRSEVVAKWGDLGTAMLPVDPEIFRAALEHVPDVGTLRKLMEAVRAMVLAAVALLTTGKERPGSQPNRRRGDGWER